MKCLRPIIVRNKSPDGFAFLEVPCNKCYACRHNRQVEWSIRLMEESKSANYSRFITFTYDEEHLVYGSKDATTDKKYIQNFIKRVRAKKELKGKLRYYCVGEYGLESARPHYHFFLFADYIEDIDIFTREWNNGFFKVGACYPERAMYITKFHITAGSTPEGSEKSFVLMSLKPAIGIKYLDRMKEYHRDNINVAFYSNKNIKMRLPRIYKNRLYSKQQRNEINEKYGMNEDTAKEIKEYLKKYSYRTVKNFCDYKLTLKENYCEMLKKQSKKNETI